MHSRDIKVGNIFTNKLVWTFISMYVRMYMESTYACSTHTDIYGYIQTLVSNCLFVYVYVLFYFVFFIKYVWIFQNYGVKKANKRNKKKKKTKKSDQERQWRQCWNVSMPRVGVISNVKNVTPTKSTSKGSVCVVSLTQIPFV